MFHPEEMVPREGNECIFPDFVDANPFLNQRDRVNHEIDCETFVEIIF